MTEGEAVYRLRATLDDDGQITKMVVEDIDEPLAKDWEKWDEEHPYEPHPRVANEVAGSQHDEHGTSVDLHGSSDPLSKISDGSGFADAVKDQSSTLNPDEVKALGIYTSQGGSEEINGVLRTGDAPSGATAEEYAPLISSIDNAFATSGNQMSSDTTVYRGINDRDGTFGSGLEPGNVLQDSAFLSTSSSREEAEAFGYTESSWMVEVTMPAGTPYLLGNPGEQEVLLGRNTSLVVDSVDYDKGVVKAHGV